MKTKKVSLIDLVLAVPAVVGLVYGIAKYF